MKKILHLVNGEMVIGDLESEPDATADVVIYHPMYIVQTMSDMAAVGFKLEDMLLFSSDDYVLVKQKNIVTTLTPSSSISEYHTHAVEFNKVFVKPLVEAQIADSIMNVRESIDAINNGKKSKDSRFKRTRLN